jgi:tetratricopeptide (TPR) repeat protein
MRPSILLGAVAAAVLLAGCVNRDPIHVYHKTSAFKEGEALFMRKRYVQARSKFREVANSPVVNNKKWCTEARYYIARCDHLTGHFSEAVRIYNALLRSPNYPRLDVQIRAARADIMRQLGKHELAAGDYRQARRILERNPVLVGKTVDREKLLFGEAVSLYGLRRYRESDQLFDRLMADNPESRFLEAIKDYHTKFRGRPEVTTFYVLVGGLFRIKIHAEHLASKVRAKGFKNVTVDKRYSASGSTYAVRVGVFQTRQEAHARKKSLMAAGFVNAEVRP